MDTAPPAPRASPLAQLDKARTKAVVRERIYEPLVEEAMAFAKAFTDESVAVRLAAMEAFAAFFRSLGKKNQAKYFELLPQLPTWPYVKAEIVRNIGYRSVPLVCCISAPLRRLPCLTST